MTYTGPFDSVSRHTGLNRKILANWRDVTCVPTNMCRNAVYDRDVWDWDTAWKVEGVLTPRLFKMFWPTQTYNTKRTFIGVGREWVEIIDHRTGMHRRVHSRALIDALSTIVSTHIVCETKSNVTQIRAA